MIALETARRLLNFGASIGDGRRADEQLEGAVAIHNILERHRVAYLADEVGMGKTYVALGAMALFRHFNAEFRVLVIAPRENIQEKWMKELSNFCANNVRFADLRVKSMRGGSARPMVACRNLHEFVHEVGVDPRRDFFLRMTSFSMGLSGDPEGWKVQRQRLRRELPWLADEVFDLRSKEVFKDNYARAVCCALPVFDLVIVDEGHNLKHGFREGVAARNRMLALAMGRDVDANEQLFPGYGRRAKRVLFLSATPVEDSYRQLWNQLDVFGIAGPFAQLASREAEVEAKKEVASRFLVRRVTTMSVRGVEMTKNQYRREWRQGGVLAFDEPIKVEDPRKRLVVALVQKKVAELLGSSRFNMSFQIGMLASFESFLQTAKLRRDDDLGNFDDPDQTRDQSDDVKAGLDVRDLNRLARNYYSRFQEHLPHPKMDEVVESLAAAWLTGRKSLVFVRRVASVTELEQRLNERYDKWLIPLLRESLPPEVLVTFDATVAAYRTDKERVEAVQRGRLASGNGADEDAEDDRGGTNTFFAWFFRGEGPKGVVSGARVARRFIAPGSAYRTFFERNHVAEVLGSQPGHVATQLTYELGVTLDVLRAEVQRRAVRFLSARTTKHPVSARFLAAQAAALELLGESGGAKAPLARLIFEQVYQGEERRPSATKAVDVADSLEERTFYTELLKPEWQALRAELWPTAEVSLTNFRETELRARILATTARLGHGLIDLYVLTIKRLKTLALRRLEADDIEGADLESRRLAEYLERLESQRVTPLTNRRWAAFDELREVAVNYGLILDVNAPEARTKPLGEAARMFGTLMAQQQPIGGMFGEVSKRLVRQFRMPGYPLVLVTTDLLQEGEDLHTFCSSIQHYGISWTPSSMEQRTGRIDRVRSQTDRRLSSLDRTPEGEDLLQVHFPFLQDSVEILQVERVLERMNVFLRLMHEGLLTNGSGEKQIDVAQILVRGRRPVEVISKRLESAFRIANEMLKGEVKQLLVTPALSEMHSSRLSALRSIAENGLSIEWSQSEVKGQLLGTMTLQSGRIQPFTLFMDSMGERLVIRCISPIGVVDVGAMREAIAESTAKHRVRLAAVREREEGSYNLTVQEDVLLAATEHDAVRVRSLLARVAEEADRLEAIHLPGRDRSLDLFRADLLREGVAEP